MWDIDHWSSAMNMGMWITCNTPTSLSVFFQSTNTRSNYMMCSVLQERQTGTHSMIGDWAYRSVLVSYVFLHVIRNSLISRMCPSLMLLLNTVYRVVAVRIGVLEKRGYWNGRIRVYPEPPDVICNPDYSLSRQWLSLNRFACSAMNNQREYTSNWFAQQIVTKWPKIMTEKCISKTHIVDA